MIKSALFAAGRAGTAIITCGGSIISQCQIGKDSVTNRKNERGKDFRSLKSALAYTVNSYPTQLSSDHGGWRTGKLISIFTSTTSANNLNCRNTQQTVTVTVTYAEQSCSQWIRSPHSEIQAQRVQTSGDCRKSTVFHAESVSRIPA